MKKNTLFSAIAILGFASTASAQVPNEGFEYWENAKTDVPANWQLQGLNSKTAGKSGGFALHMANNLGTGDISYASQAAFDSLSFYAPAFAFAGTPDSVQITFKSQLGMDTAYLEFGFSKGPDLIAYGEAAIFGNSGLWETKTFEVVYISGIPAVDADSGYINIYSADDIFGPYSNGSIDIDDIVFIKKDQSALPNIPNHSFETWQSVSVEYPGAWASTALLQFENGTAFNNTVRSTDAHKGTSAIELRGMVLPSAGSLQMDTFPGIAVTKRENSSANSSGVFEPSFAINARYNSIRGFIKSDLKANDIAMVWVNIFSADSLVGSAVYTDGSSHSTYLEFSEDIAWDPAFSGIPDSATFALILSDSNLNHPNSLSSWVRFDDLRFDNWTSGVQESQVSVKAGMHPNPSTGAVNLQISSNVSAPWQLIVRNLNGQVMLETAGIANTGKSIIPLDLSTLSKGIYITEIRVANTQTTDKIILIP